MALPQTQRRISPEEYLQGELESDIKHQLIDGEAYAMAGASENHNLLAGIGLLNLILQHRFLQSGPALFQPDHYAGY